VVGRNPTYRRRRRLRASERRNAQISHFLEYFELAALGIAGAFVATYLGQALGWYQEGQAAGFIGATLGAILILLVWGFIASRRQTP
jgi:hypothetical protein